MMGKTHLFTILISVMMLAGCGGGEKSFVTVALQRQCYRDKATGTEISASVYFSKLFDGSDRCPLVFVADTELFNTDSLFIQIDSMITSGILPPMLIVGCDSVTSCSASLMTDVLIPGIHSSYHIDRDRTEVLCGQGLSADLCVEIGMTHPETADAFWCFSPTVSDLNEFGMTDGSVSFCILHNLKIEPYENLELYSSLINSIRKRGGKVSERTYSEHFDVEGRTGEFLQMLQEHFGL